MGLSIGKLFGGSAGKANGVTTYYGAPVSKTSAIAYQNSGYASIPYERAPKVTDTVPTEGLLEGYSTPKQVWVA